MKKNVEYPIVTDRELLVNTSLFLLTMIRNCKDSDYCYHLRKAYINLNAVIELMKTNNDFECTI